MAMTSCLVSSSISFTLSGLTKLRSAFLVISAAAAFGMFPKLGMGPGQGRLYFQLGEEAVLLGEYGLHLVTPVTVIQWAKKHQFSSRYR